MITIKSKGEGTLLVEMKNKSLLLFPNGKFSKSDASHILLASSDKEDGDNIISWPGEYDIEGCSILCLGRGDTEQVSYIITSDNVRCGFISSPLQNFSETEEEVLGDIDVLILPADDIKKAQKLVEEVDPRVVIPINTGDDKVFAEVVAACGGKDTETVKEVKLKKSSLPMETREVYVLSK